VPGHQINGPVRQPRRSVLSDVRMFQNPNSSISKPIAAQVTLALGCREASCDPRSLPSAGITTAPPYHPFAGNPSRISSISVLGDPREHLRGCGTLRYLNPCTMSRLWKPIKRITRLPCRPMPIEMEQHLRWDELTSTSINIVAVFLPYLLQIPELTSGTEDLSGHVCRSSAQRA
jgi:hypothetical protein